MNSHEDKSCPLCGKRHYDTVNNGLLKCGGCGIVLNPQVWEERTNEANEEEWFENKQMRESFWIRMFQACNNRRTWRIMRRLLPAHAKVLEIGPGTGSLLRFLSNCGVEVEGCDLASSICKHIQDVDRIRMHNCPVGEIPVSHQYDIVVMNHVLEHVNDPIHFLQGVKKCLAPEGSIVVAVPNISCWEACLPGWNSYEPYHLVYFNHTTLRRTVENAGFQVIQVSNHDSFSGWFLAILRTLLQTNKKSAAQRNSRRAEAELSWLGHVYRFAMVLSGVITWPLRLFQQAIGRGDEVIMIAKKI